MELPPTAAALPGHTNGGHTITITTMSQQLKRAHRRACRENVPAHSLLHEGEAGGRAGGRQGEGWGRQAAGMRVLR